ncbi:cation:proton antiporter domain-containing protein [Pedococcus sp. 5OH_020]|uniref:cation:proton antiporter domain-containing protein n=1 Tax=Pedococcus sp. 5OH_020 TaxID=2989814 RepID=UPI0022E9EE4C|nr:cation:proton antiporter [Pedococcus sp. 5OH_020]
MSDTERYALAVLLCSAAALVAVLSNRLTERIRVPAALLMFVGAAVVAGLVPTLKISDLVGVQHVVTIALVLILFDGGMHIGWRRFRAAAAPIASVGVLGTFLTAAACAVLLHVAFGVDWYLALLVATAVAPTDPAVVFSVLGQREIRGRSGTILEGESGGNDPVGIALMAGLLAAAGLSWMAVRQVAAEFLLQMTVGLAVGIVGGWALLWFMRRFPLPSEALYPLRTVFCALALYGVGTLAQGSGFLAVFVAGIAIGDPGAPYKREIERFHSALASMGEIVAFLVLGLTVDLPVLARADVWVPGLVLAIALALVIRPVLVGACLLPARLRSNELAFVLFAGLKGAVPILLGELLRTAHVPQAERLFGIIVVVVVFSVLVQGGLVPAAVSLLRLPTRLVHPEPWAVGVRLRAQPEGVHRLLVEPGAPADGATVADVAGQVGDGWISIVVRDRVLVVVRDDTRLQAGDEVVVLADRTQQDSLASIFASPR